MARYLKSPLVLSGAGVAFLAVVLSMPGCGNSASSSSSSTTTTTATTTTLAASSVSVTYGTSVTLTATVSPTAATGTVTFYDGSTSLGSVTLSSSTASLTTSSLSVGTHTVTASYGGSSTYSSSTSSSVTITVTSSSTTATTTTLEASSTSIAYGKEVTLTATVSPSEATGTVDFYDSSTLLGSETLSSGTAAFTTSSLSVGTHTLTASYGGSSTYSSSTSSSVSITVTSATAETWNISTGANSEDLVENTTFDYKVSINLADLSISTSSSLLEVGTATSGSTPITLNGETVITVTEDTYGLTIDSSMPDSTYVEFALSGDYSGSITFYSTAKFKLSLNGANITSSDGPALNIQSEERAFIVLGSGTTNTLSGPSTYTTRYLSDGSEMDLKGALFSEGAVIFSGTGSLGVTAKAKHAVVSDDHVRIREGTYTISASKKDGIHTNRAFVMDDGTVTIETASGAGKGIKVEGEEDDTTPLGFIAINAGTLNITSYDKAITAHWVAEDDAETTTLDDDPDPRVTINGGTITITTFGTPYEDTDLTDGDDSLSPEGIESKSILTINDGTLSINTTDDGLNAITGLVINGGRLYVRSTANDAVDSNGYLTITGGVLVAEGTNSPEGGLDCDVNTFTITGGTIVGIGGANSTPTATVSTQNSVLLTNGTANTLLVIKDSSGNVPIAFLIPRASTAMLFSSSGLQTGVSYTVYTGGTLTTYTEEFNGLYLGAAGYSGGSASKSFTISSTVMQP